MPLPYDVGHLRSIPGMMSITNKYKIITIIHEINCRTAQQCKTRNQGILEQPRRSHVDATALCCHTTTKQANCNVSVLRYTQKCFMLRNFKYINNNQ